MADQSATLPFWSRPGPDLVRELGSGPGGLSAEAAAERLGRFGANRPRSTARLGALRLALRQFRSPIAILLLVTAILSGFAAEPTDAIIILVILLGSAALGFWQEWTATTAVEELLALITSRARVRRDSREIDVDLEAVVPGDLVVLNAGDLVPADCRILEAKDLQVDEAALTGESFPSAKDTAASAPDAELGGRRGAVFMGTHVVTGTASALVVATGASTIYGALAGGLRRESPESEFERGVRRFGYLLLEIAVTLVLVVVGLNLALGRPLLEVFLFALALAVGLTPQLLPAIVSITLAHGARRMAKSQVIVRRLVAIVEFGGMNILCTDKTGTLTEGIVRVRSALGPDGRPSTEVGRLAYLNAVFQSGFDNPIDVALRAMPGYESTGFRKLDEVPYDFVRRRLSVLVEEPGGGRLLITKGAVEEVLSVCGFVQAAEGGPAPLGGSRDPVARLTAEMGQQGVRCLGVAFRRLDGSERVTRADERDMIFAGVLTLADPPKAGIRGVLDRLDGLGVRVKVVTGDNRLVAAAIAREVGLNADQIMTGSELRAASDVTLRGRLAGVDVFAEVDPNQKERIILALKATGSSVGYLGDGINDAAALHAADIGISVDTAVDVTKQAADVVLLRKDLSVLVDGIQEGRRAFANTLKYVFVTSSANFGNMLSMAGAALIVAFLPMLPKQILLLNLLSDLPAMAIATDTLDPELVARPRRWDVRYIRNFTILFGLVSSVCDYLTFGFLMALTVPVAQFRTGWFLESVLTEIFVLLVIRTGRAFYRSRPSRPLLVASAGIAAVTLLLPYLPGATLLGFAPLPAGLLLGLLAITVLLLVLSEGAKRVFLAHHAAMEA